MSIEEIKKEFEEQLRQEGAVILFAVTNRELHYISYGKNRRIRKKYSDKALRRELMTA